ERPPVGARCATLAVLAARETLFERAYRFGRAIVVGSGATAIDFCVLTSCIRVAGIAPTHARIPALVAGATFQFFGNRTFTFRAQAESMSRQAKLFVAAELVCLLLNFTVFRWLVPRIHFLPPELVSLLGTFIIFATIGYPLRKLVIFKVPDRRSSEPRAMPESRAD
ncbi:MAG: GtrA family protein, partial [Polyangiaceae bacterium]